VLAIETSCDDTCAAVVEGPTILSSIVSSQVDLHAEFGGVVPEVASRRHLELIAPVAFAALEQAGVAPEELDGVAVTAGPGLIGALLVGLSSAKAFAAAFELPLLPVDHLQGHVAANFLEPDPLDPPFLCLVASGGHTFLAGVRSHGEYESLGSTLDDAAGEALDKAARMLGLGFPGGPAIQAEAESGDPRAFDLPVGMADDPGLDFSFSGLKTALAQLVSRIGEEEATRRRADLSAAFQEAVVAQLMSKLESAAERGDWSAVALGGGVAANSLLRLRSAELCERLGLALKQVPVALCTDNAAMIGSAARWVHPIPFPDYLDYDAFASTA